MSITNLYLYLFVWVKPLMLLARRVVPRLSLVFRHTRHRCFWLLVIEQNWRLRSMHSLQCLHLKKKKKKLCYWVAYITFFSFLVDIFHYPLFWKGSLSWRRILIIGKKITKVGSRNILRLWPNSFPSFHRGYNFLKIWFVINLIVPCKSTNLSCSVFLPSRKYNAYKDHIKLSRIYLLGKTSLKEKFLITI